MKNAFVIGALAFLTTGHASVIQNDALIVAQGTPPYFFPFARTFTVTSAPFLVIEVTTGTPGKFTFQYQGIAEAYSLFRVSTGTDFTASFVNSQTAFVNNWNSPGTGVLTLTPGQSAYLAYWDQGFGPPRLTAGDADLFGWAQVTNSGGNLVITASATADGGGIRVGTLQQIPEPGAIMLFAASVCFSCRRRSRIGSR